MDQPSNVTSTRRMDGKVKSSRAFSAPQGTVTLLFGGLDDVSGMTERLGDQPAFEVVKCYQSIVREQIRRHAGYEVEFQGDAFLVAFSAVSRGVRAAIAIATELASWSAEHVDRATAAKLGLHVGEPIREGNRFFGKPVIMASRIAAAARAGEIMVSSLVTDLLDGNEEFAFDGGADVELKGLAGKHRVHRALWRSAPLAPAEPAMARDAPPLAVDREGTNRFRLDGDFWTIVYAGKTVRVRDAKGLRYVAALLRRPGEDVHVADLAGPAYAENGAADAGGGEIMVGLGHAGEVLDDKARAEYRRRLAGLPEELEAAKRANDAERLEALESEKEFLARELSSAVGLGGRVRKASDVAERARKAVTSRIRDSIGRIAKEHPELAGHLTTALRLGTFCRYEPEVTVGWAA